MTLAQQCHLSLSHISPMRAERRPHFIKSHSIVVAALSTDLTGLLQGQIWFSLLAQGWRLEHLECIRCKVRVEAGGSALPGTSFTENLPRTELIISHSLSSSDLSSAPSTRAAWHLKKAID